VPVACDISPRKRPTTAALREHPGIVEIVTKAENNGKPAAAMPIFVRHAARARPDEANLDRPGHYG